MSVVFKDINKLFGAQIFFLHSSLLFRKLFFCFEVISSEKDRVNSSLERTNLSSWLLSLPSKFPISHHINQLIRLYNHSRPGTSTSTISWRDSLFWIFLFCSKKEEKRKIRKTRQFQKFYFQVWEFFLLMLICRNIFGTFVCFAFWVRSWGKTFKLNVPSFDFANQKWVAR